MTKNGGKTWLLNTIVPSLPNRATSDITVRFSGKNNLYAGILRIPGGLRLNILRTNNFLGASTMTVLVDRTGAGVDQPYVQAHTTGGEDRVYVGNNDFSSPGGKTATVDQSLDAGLPTPMFQSIRIEKRTTSGQDGPPIRPAIHADGTVYAAFYGWRSFTGGIATADVVVVRDDAGGSGPNPFTALLDDPGDGLAGRRVVTDVTVPFENFSHPNFGQERFVASNLSIAVDPRRGKSGTVCVAWADRANPTAPYTIHVRGSTDKGGTWSTVDLRTIPNATNPALAINSRGMVGFLYQQVCDTDSGQRWNTCFERTNSNFTAVHGVVLASVPAGVPLPQFLPYVGDYVHVMAVGNEFFGIFSANNTPNPDNFPNKVKYQRNAVFDRTSPKLLGVDGTTPVGVSIDPFFFKVTE